MGGWWLADAWSGGGSGWMVGWWLMLLVGVAVDGVWGVMASRITIAESKYK
ncbi:hypothetical protein [Limnofasciculus baicalensis]|uniref:Uncharacterized protein n=1 Tax=Limnofasciculus baicalensis BBK-W-15 TaxID=2699891 RepID=A0AAE3KPC6_9CYAN|nr:hypothetical protein [Limnofasciculus baicalensis]MCP2731174.1 hypothetical protein [Limnofasciculus baicalensis BBK-W-15]